MLLSFPVGGFIKFILSFITGGVLVEREPCKVFTFVCTSPLIIYPPDPCLLPAVGAESNSEYSFGSGILLSDSRESSIETSSVHSRAVWDQDDRRQRGRSSGAASAKGLDWDTSGGHTLEKTGETLSHDESDQKSDKVSTQELWGVVGEEE